MEVPTSKITVAPCVLVTFPRSKPVKLAALPAVVAVVAVEAFPARLPLTVPEVGKFERARAVEVRGADSEAALIVDDLRDLRTRDAGEDERREGGETEGEGFHGMPSFLPNNWQVGPQSHREQVNS